MKSGRFSRDRRFSFLECSPHRLGEHLASEVEVMAKDLDIVEVLHPAVLDA
jgi:hypothetical protein